MKPATEIVAPYRQESPYICSACGADRGCDCNAPALKKLAQFEAKREAHRQANREAMRKSREAKCTTRDVEKTEEIPIAESTSPTIFRPNLDREEFRTAKAHAIDARARGAARRREDRDLVAAHSLLGALTDSTAEIRSLAVTLVMGDGSWQSYFKEITEAVADLYQQLSKVRK